MFATRRKSWRTFANSKIVSKPGRHSKNGTSCNSHSSVMYRYSRARRSFFFRTSQKTPSLHPGSSENALWGTLFYTIASDDLFLLGVLNSSTVETIYRNMSAPDQRWLLEILHSVRREKSRSRKQNRKIGKQSPNLASRCVQNNGRDVRDAELEIDDRVARLYGIPPTPIDFRRRTIRTTRLHRLTIMESHGHYRTSVPRSCLQKSKPMSVESEVRRMSAAEPSVPTQPLTFAVASADDLALEIRIVLDTFPGREFAKSDSSGSS